MKTLKFRAWSYADKKFYHRVLVGNTSTDEPCSLIYNEDYQDWIHFNKSYGEITQFTGYQDKNGVDIYEGDIVSRFSDTQRSVVEFKDGCFVSMIQLSGLGEPRYEILCNDLSVTVVIGNKFQNPELLDQIK